MGRVIGLFLLAVFVVGFVLWMADALPFFPGGEANATADHGPEKKRDSRQDAKGPGQRISRLDPGPLRLTTGPVLFDAFTAPDCTITPLEQQDVPSQVDGVFQQMMADLGHYVQPGQVLGKLDDRRYQIVEKANRIKKNSELGKLIAEKSYLEAYARVKDADEARLKGIDSVSGFEYRMNIFQRDRYKAEMDKAEEDRQIAEQEWMRIKHDLDQHEIKADIAGTVTLVYKKRGESVKALEPVFRVVNLDRLRVEGMVDVQQADRLRVGMRALVEPELQTTAYRALSGHTGEVTSLAVTPDGNLLASASLDGTVVLWNWRSGSQASMLIHKAEVNAVAADPSKRAPNYVFLVGCADGRAWLWRVSTDGKVDKLELGGEKGDGHQGAVKSVAFSADGKFCATGGDDKRICIWKADDGKLLYSLHSEGEGRPMAHRGPVTNLQFTKEGELVSTGNDDMLKVWKIGATAGKVVVQQPGRTGEVNQLGVSPDGRYMLFDHGEELRILDLKNDFRTVGTLRSGGHGRFDVLALFSPSGRLVLTTAANRGLQLWSVPAAPDQAEFFRQSYGHGFNRGTLGLLSGLTTAATPGGRWAFVTAADALTIKGAGAMHGPAQLWRLNAYEVRHLKTPENAGLTCGAFAPNDSTLFTGGADKVVRVWTVPPAEETNDPIEAQITYVGRQVTPGVGQVMIRAEFDNPRSEQRRLRTGTSASLTLFPETAPKP